MKRINPVFVLIIIIINTKVKNMFIIYNNAITLKLFSNNFRSVRTATVPAFASLIVSNNVRFVHDKCYVQLQTFLSDPTSRDDPDMLLVLVQGIHIFLISTSYYIKCIIKNKILNSII